MSPLTLEPPPTMLDPRRSEPLASLSIAKIEAGFRILTNSKDNMSFSLEVLVVFWVLVFTVFGVPTVLPTVVLSL
jgi:hypothetical protein